jgi:hypothetical protein
MNSTTSISDQFRIEDEETDECEWYTFNDAALEPWCKNTSTKVIIFREKDTEYDMHWAHLCNAHIDRAFKIAQENVKLEFCRRP